MKLAPDIVGANVTKVQRSVYAHFRRRDHWGEGGLNFSMSEIVFPKTESDVPHFGENY